MASLSLCSHSKKSAAGPAHWSIHGLNRLSIKASPLLVAVIAPALAIRNVVLYSPCRRICCCHIRSQYCGKWWRKSLYQNLLSLYQKRINPPKVLSCPLPLGQIYYHLLEQRERQSKLRLKDFAKEIRSFVSVDLSGRDFGDEGLFFLAESLAYNQVSEEVFAANGITADGIKAFDGILQSNIALKSPNLSGNSIGDEGVKSLRDILVNNDSIQISEASAEQ